MNLSLLIAKRISIFEKKSFSLFISRVSIIAIALSVSVMIIGTAVTRGYQEHISKKFYDCWGHIHITNFVMDPSNVLSDEKIERNDTLIAELKKTEHIKSVCAYSLLSSIIKTKDGIEGIVLKGMQNKEGFSSMKPFIVEGRQIEFNDSSYSKEIILSKTMAKNMNFKLNENIILYFLSGSETQPKARKVKIVGLFNTGLEEYDKIFTICDSKLINNVNKDSSNIIQGYEIFLDDVKNSKQIEKKIFEQYLEPPLEIYTIEKRFASVFSWLDMMKMNERIIVVIMMIIAIINMISALLILILERTPMIGILKSLGMSNGKIQQIFLFSSLYIISIGVSIGTFIGLLICFIQMRFGIIKLDEEIYYINQVPIALHIENIIMIISITIISCISILIIPSLLVRKISPTKALNFK